MPHPLSAWRFTPVADPDDPAWQDRKIWDELTLVAGSAGEAMLAAGRHYMRVKGLTVEMSQDHQQVESGFDDPKLYRVDRQRAPLDPDQTAGTILSETWR